MPKTIGYFMLTTGAEIIAEELPPDNNHEYLLRNPLIVDDNETEDGMDIVALDRFDRFNSTDELRISKAAVIGRSTCSKRMKEHYATSVKFNKRFVGKKVNVGIDALMSSMKRMLEVPEISDGDAKDQRLLQMPTHSEIHQ